jgi:hypothetical protein
MSHSFEAAEEAAGRLTEALIVRGRGPRIFVVQGARGRSILQFGATVWCRV